MTHLVFLDVVERQILVEVPHNDDRSPTMQYRQDACGGSPSVKKGICGQTYTPFVNFVQPDVHHVVKENDSMIERKAFW